MLLGVAFPAFQPWMAVVALGLSLMLFWWYWVLRKGPAAQPAALAITSSAALPMAGSEPNAGPEELLEAMERLQKAGAEVLLEHAESLLSHPDGRVRHRILGLMGCQLPAAPLRQVALTDSSSVLRELASQLLGRRLETDELLHHPDVAVRIGALRGRLEAAPDDAPAHAHLAAAASATDAAARFTALALIDFLPLAQQVALVEASLHSAEPDVVQAAAEAAAGIPSAALAQQLVALLRVKAVRAAAAASLLRLGDVALTALAEALAQETDRRRLRVLAHTCARLATPTARRVLVRAAQNTCLPKRAAALRALGSFDTVPDDAPLFQRLVEEEMQLAQQLMHGMLEASAELDLALRYELGQCRARLFGSLLQVFERPLLLEAQRAVAYATPDRQAPAMEALDEVLPRPLYQGLQALLDAGRLRSKVQALDDLLGPYTSSEPIQAAVVRRGATAFSGWTIAVALRQWQARANTVAHLYPHLLSKDLLVQQSAHAVLRQLAGRRPAAHEQLVLLHPDVISLSMNNSASSPGVSAHERVLLLKGTALFGETPENVLGTIVPILKEIAFQPGQEIFEKGSLGTSLFIVCEGEVDIFDGKRLLTTFHKGDFFGELALLDAAPRSATAVARGHIETLRLDQEEFYDVMEECPEVLHNILRVLCQRLRRQNEMSLKEA